jgi:hypothetical protein
MIDNINKLINTLKENIKNIHLQDKNNPYNNSLNNPKIVYKNQKTIETLHDNSLINNTSIQNNITISNNIQIQINRIMEKLQKLEITNRDLLYKILDRLTLDKQKTFLNELELLIDILSSKDIEKKLHPKVVTAIKDSITSKAVIINGKVITDENKNIIYKEEQEFKNLEDFRNKLLTHLLDALSDPNRISQHRKGTCGQTVIERNIAEESPDQYVKIISELITQGYYTAPNSQKVPLNTGGIRKIKNEIDYRLLCTRIITPSFMEFHYNKDPNIDDYNDDMDKPFGSYSYKTASAIYNTQYVMANTLLLNNTQKTQILKELLKLSLKYPIFLAVNYGIGPHKVELKNIKDNSIVISNPWGQIETYTLNSLEVTTPWQKIKVNIDEKGNYQKPSNWDDKYFQDFIKYYNKNYNEFIENIIYITIPAFSVYKIREIFPHFLIQISNNI